jgi:hypothetical protein
MYKVGSPGTGRLWIVWKGSSTLKKEGKIEAGTQGEEADG